MNTPLLLTKIHMPAVRAEFVPRPRLVNQLTAPGKLTLICAPAGFGKTTLASCWLAQKNQRAAWLSLDESDNDLHRFFTYFTIALQQINPAVGQNVLDTLQTPNPPTAPIFLSHLINDLTQSNEQFTLVLDDYHLIDTETIHDALTFLVENQPPQLHLVILSRTEPPLPIVNLRAKNQLINIQANDLRFTRAESEAFFNQAMQLGLTDDQIAQLENQTEGWVTGLQLAALSLKETSDPVTFIRRLSGHDRYIADYLVNEVISYQPLHIQEFLLQTAVLGRMNADLCNAVLGITNSQSILETLETANLFIIPLDNNREWYRYHHLFADTLQRQLEQQDAKQMIHLHRAAAIWFMEHDMLPESIEHSLVAKDYARVIQHLDEIIDQILAGGRFKTYLRWLNKVPQTYLTPSIALYQLFFLYEMGEFDEAAKKLKIVEALLGPMPQDIEELDTETAVYFGILSVIKGVKKAAAFAVDEALPYFVKALQLLPEEKIFWRALALGANGFCHRVNGNYNQAIDIYAKVINLAIESKLVFISFMYAIALAKLCLEYGQLEKAIHTSKRLLDFHEKQTVNNSFAGLAYVVLGELLYHTGELPQAEKHIKQGLDQVNKDGEAFTIASSYFTLAQIYLAQNKIGSAQKSLNQMRKVLDQLSPSQTIQKIQDAYQAYFQINTNQLDQAKAWATRPGYDYLESKQNPDLRSLPYLGIYRTGQRQLNYFANIIRLVTARLAIATNNAHEATRILDALMNKAEQSDYVLFTAEVLIQQSLAQQNLGNMDQATNSLLQAVQQIAPEPFFQIFVSEGEKLRPLLQKAHAQASNPQTSLFITQILEKMPPPQSPKDTLYNLTPREIDVLNCLAQGLTYVEAANQMSVSINTFKSYIKRSYSKLGVTNRTHAITKAKDLNLLTTSNN